MKKINVCPGTLAVGYETYSSPCLRKMFGGKRVSHILDFNYEETQAEIASAINRISISGVQWQDSIDSGRGIRTVYH